MFAAPQDQLVAITDLPFLLSVLGWVPGIITMVVAGVLFWITSITMHKFIMKHPQIKDICKQIPVRQDTSLLYN
jgi:hypothetical protein